MVLMPGAAVPWDNGCRINSNRNSMPSTLKSHYWAAVFCTAAVALTSAAFADDAFGPMAVPAAAQPFKLGPLRLIALRDAQFVMHNDGKTFGSDADVATVGNLLKGGSLPDD